MADKRISQLNSHTSPTGSDLLVIVNNNETKKITYANLTAAITGSQTDISALNQFTQSIDSRVDNLESWSSSLDSTFATDLQVSIVSSSVAATIGVISQNTGLVSTSSFNQFTQSIDSRVDGIENLTSSFATTGSNEFTGSQNISGSIVVDGTINASSISTPTISIGGGYIVSDGNDVSIGTDAMLGYKILTNANTHTFQFGLDGNFTAPGNIIGATNFNTLLNKPTLISGSAQITALGFTSQSVSISSLNSFTASYFTDSASIDNRVLTEKGRIDAILSASNANSDTFAEIVTLINSVDLDNDNAFATFYTSSNARIQSLENATGSYITSLNGTISGSSQLTSSYDTRYTLSGSVQPLPNGVISGSSQLTSSYDDRYTLSSSFSSVSSSFNSRFNGLVTTGSNTFSGSQVFSGSMTVTSGQVIASTITNNSSSLFLQSGSNLYIQNDGVVEITGSIILNGTTYTSLTGSGTIPAGTISGSSQLTSSFDLRYATSASYLTSLNGALSSSNQLTSSFDTRYTLSGSVQPLPSGVISGSSQLTSSYDIRYALSGSGGTIPAGTVSGSSQLTSSYDGRYTLTSSFNSFTASAQTVTTGSNSFNGTQTITGSLIITTGSFIGSQILANTSSLYLTSGSNIYVQNNGLVEITGSLNVTNTATLKGSVNIGTGSGLEGGEIQLAYAQTGNTTLTGSAIAFDVYADRIRIFEGGGTNRGAFLNIASQSVGVGSEIVTSPNVSTIQTLTSASYAAITPVSGTLYIIIG